MPVTLKPILSDVFSSWPPSLPEYNWPARILYSSGFHNIYRQMKILASGNKQLIWFCSYQFWFDELLFLSIEVCLSLSKATSFTCLSLYFRKLATKTFLKGKEGRGRQRPPQGQTSPTKGTAMSCQSFLLLRSDRRPLPRYNGRWTHLAWTASRQTVDQTASCMRRMTCPVSFVKSDLLIWDAVPRKT